MDLEIELIAKFTIVESGRHSAKAAEAFTTERGRTIATTTNIVWPEHRSRSERSERERCSERSEKGLTQNHPKIF